MRDTLVESQGRTVRGNRILISLRLLLATLSLAILLIQEYSTVNRRSIRSGWPVNGGVVTTLSFSNDSKFLYSGGRDGFIRIWDVEKSQEVGTGIQAGGVIIRASLDPMGKRLAVVTEDARLRVLELNNQSDAKFSANLEHNSLIRFAEWSPDGTKIITGGYDGPLTVWDVATGKVIVHGEADSKNMVIAGYLPGGQILSVSTDGRELRWDPATLQLKQATPLLSRQISSARISGDGRYLAVGGVVMRIRDLQAGRDLRVVEAHYDGTNGLSFSGDSRLLISTGGDKKISVWKLDEASEYCAFPEQPYLVQSEALSFDGHWAASGCDSYVKVWNVGTGKLAWELDGHRQILASNYQPRNASSSEHVLNLPLYYRPEGMIVIIVLLLTVIYTLTLKHTEYASKLAPLQIMLDVALVSVLVYHTGDVDSPFTTMYLVSIVSAAFVLSWQAAVLVAALASTLFSVVTLLYGLGQIPSTYTYKMGAASLSKYQNLSALDYLYFLLLPICAFFLVAFLAGTLSRRLAATRHLHQEVLEGLGEGIMLMAPDRNIVYHNQEFIRMLGLAVAQPGMKLKDLLGEDVNREAESVYAGENGKRLQVSHTRSDGSIIPLGVHLIPVQEPDSTDRGLILVLDDITAEKKMEEFYKHKERIETMGQISATIAHEIRNPLASIRGAVQEIARSVVISEDKKILIEIVLSESDRLDQIITDFLRYARTRAPQLKLVDICELISSIRLLLVSRPEAQNTELQINASEDIPPFNADAEQLRQVFLNLGLNALQALDGCPQRRILLNIRVLSLHKALVLSKNAAEDRVDRPGVVVEIIDTGKGISEEVQHQMFEPFFTTKANGTGLGLAIVDRIIQGHEGLIWVESQIGEGTAFKIWLPTDNVAERVSNRLRSATMPVVK